MIARVDISLMSLVLCLMICHSSSQISSFYDVTNSSPFNGSNLTTTDPNCPTLMNCFGNNSKLTDGDFGPMDSVIGQLERFFAFNQNNSRLTFNVPSAVSTVVLYFFNSPADGIGLPQLKVILADSVFPYFFSNNDELTLTDSQLRSITLLLNQNLLTFQIDFIFPVNSRINWFLVSEVQFFAGTPVSPPMEDIVFKDGSISVMTFGPDSIQSSISINCTVLNNGSFHWNWLFNNTIPITDELFIEDATRTSILYINGLSYSIEGNYTCTANSTAGSMSSRIIIVRLEGTGITSSFTYSSKSLLYTSTPLDLHTSFTSLGTSHMFTSVASPSPLTCTLSGCERCDTTSSNCCQVCSSGYSFISDSCVCGIRSTAGIPVWSIVIISVFLVIVIVTALLLIMCTFALVKVKQKNTQSDQPFYDYSKIIH
ncbi:PREDICTED: uncharacterized protein LOC109584283 [Amphimedon queenslandica]|uniref:Ig-like domain-containing protein n=1 Tax=Amphimedon queenslandica TaxID=400682 RepID=A0AAN0JER9_AMPQE|nr:PREDICTED: uncharacterized protein LOC109584283 [Amphimedon queenslandica]|eukprot:XP_019855520.1 PREDICTED: uncharacterized protein LOC109584283 [Amphimedon queenslandica]